MHPNAKAETPLWSTHYFPPGTQLCNTRSSVFTAATGLSGQGFDRGMDGTLTNLKIGVADFAFTVHSLVVEFIPSADQHELVVLARAWENNFNPVDLMREDMLDVARNMVLKWDFIQTTIDIGIPTLARDPYEPGFPEAPDAIGFVRPVVFRFDYNHHPILLPAHEGWRVLLEFGSRAPISPGLCVRVCLYGVREHVPRRYKGI